MGENAHRHTITRACARSTMWNKASIMRRRWGDFTGVDRSSLAKSLISLNALLNIITIIGHCAGIMLSAPAKWRFDPPLEIFAAGAIANDPNTHPSPPAPSRQVLT